MKNISASKTLAILGIILGLLIAVFSIILPGSSSILSITASAPIFYVLIFFAKLFAPVIQSLGLITDLNDVGGIFYYTSIISVYSSPIIYGILGFLIGKIIEKIEGKTQY